MPSGGRHGGRRADRTHDKSGYSLGTGAVRRIGAAQLVLHPTQRSDFVPEDAVPAIVGIGDTAPLPERLLANLVRGQEPAGQPSPPLEVVHTGTLRPGSGRWRSAAAQEHEDPVLERRDAQRLPAITRPLVQHRCGLGLPIAAPHDDLPNPILVLARIHRRTVAWTSDHAHLRRGGHVDPRRISPSIQLRAWRSSRNAGCRWSSGLSMRRHCGNRRP
jgi:hypothetical protein